MAAYTAGKIADGELAYVSVSLAPRQHAPVSFGGSIPEGEAEGSLQQTKGPGDYPAVFAALALGPSQETLYEAPVRTTGIVREIVLSNTTASDVSVKLWIGSLCIEPGIVVPAGEARSQSGHWMIPPGQTFGAEGEGVSVFATGVEDVR